MKLNGKSQRKDYTMIDTQEPSTKQKRGMRLLAIFCLAIFGISCLAILLVMSKPASRDVKRRKLSVPITVGDRMITTGLVIECDITDYDMPFSTFSNSAANPDEIRVADFIRAILSGNADKAKALSKPGATAGGKNATIESNLSMLKSHWARIGISSDSSNVKILRRIYWGNREFFTYKVADPNSRPIYILSFDRDPNEGLLWSPRVEGFEWMFWEITAQRSEYPKDQDIEQSVSHDYGFTITPQDSKHPVDLLFNGHVAGITQAEDKPHSSDAALSFYETAMMSLKQAGSIQEFREIGNTYYDAHSKKKFLSWIDKDYEAFLQSINELVRREREIVFVMDADPVFIIFYHPEGMPDWYIKHDYIVCEKGKFFLTRLAYLDELGGCFQNRKKFIEPLLMPLIKSDLSGTKKDNDGNPTQ